MLSVKQYWPVKTFASETEKNYKIAIRYYEQKKQAFFNAAQQQINNSMINTIHNIPSVEQLLNDQVVKFNSEIIPPWTQLQQIKGKRSQLTNALQKWDAITKQANKKLNNCSNLAGLLNTLISSKSFIGEDTPSSLSTLEVMRWINRSLNGQTSNQQLAGDRSAAFGEIFETLFADSFINGTNDILQTLKVGTERTTRSPNSGGLVQGKSDIIFNCGISLQLANDQNGMTVGQSGSSEQVQLDASEWIDISKNGKFFQKYMNGNYAGIAGASVKQWNESIVGMKSGASSRATMGNSSFTARLIDSRWSPKGINTISWVFDNQRSFTSYTGYIVSKYLINVIGALNIFMVTGSGATTVDQWLNGLLKRNYVVAHSFGQGVVSGSERNAFIVKPGLVVAYKGEY